MKKIILFAIAAIALMSCSSPSDKVAETYFKAVVSQEVSNPDKSLVEVAPFETDSLKAQIIEFLNKRIGRNQSALDGLEPKYYSAEEFDATKQRISDEIEFDKNLVENVKAMDFPQYYHCSYNGKHYEFYATEDAANIDDFKHNSNFIWKLVDQIVAENKPAE